MQVFFIQDGIKFVDLIHAGKPAPQVSLPQAQTAHDSFWDFISLVPESTFMSLFSLSDYTIPRSYRMIKGFGVNTFVLVNAEGKRTFVKFHWKPHLGSHGLVWDEALKLGGQDPDYLRLRTRLRPARTRRTSSACSSSRRSRSRRSTLTFSTAPNGFPRYVFAFSSDHQQSVDRAFGPSTVDIGDVHSTGCSQNNS